MNYPNDKYDTDWKEELTDEEYHVLRNKGTERPFSGRFNAHYEKGTYFCRGCGTPLFNSGSKFDSGCGWPSFDSELEEAGIERKVDRSHGMIRTEIICSNCGGHLGHVFNDGPTKTGERYCVNSVSLTFSPDNEAP